MPLKTFTFKNEVFITGRTGCPCCGHKFRYSLTFAQLLIWDHYCAVCTTALPFDLPAKGKITGMDEALDVEEYM